MIRMGDLAAEVRAIRAEIDAAIAEVLDAGRFVLGERGEAFERAYGAWLGGGGAPARVVGCASGTEALALALRALGVGPGSVVATVPNSCAPTAAGIRMTGAALRFVDVDPEHLLLDPRRLADLLGRERIDAVVPVHLFGNPAPMIEILDLCRSRGLPVVEDCAQSHGAKTAGRPTGTLGDAGAFSFYPSKNLGAYGDAGCVATADPEVAARAARLRNHGYDPARRDFALEEGWNARLDELQAAILGVKLRHVDAWNDARRANAARYDAALAGRAGPRPVRPRDGDIPSRHLYVVRTSRRDALAAHLERLGIESQIHYATPIPLQPGYREAARVSAPCPVAEAAAAEILSVPVHPHLGGAEVDRVAAGLAEFAEGAR